jgi:hypothetical protein
MFICCHKKRYTFSQDKTDKHVAGTFLCGACENINWVCAKQGTRLDQNANFFFFSKLIQIFLFFISHQLFFIIIQIKQYQYKTNFFFHFFI